MGKSTQTFFNSSQRFDIMLRDDFTCRYCGVKSQHTELEVDHVLPVTLGGKATQDNGVTACKLCNRGKRNKLLSEVVRLPIAPENVLLKELMDARMKSYSEASQQKHRYRRQLWRELVREYELDFDDRSLREAIAEAAMEWAVMGIPIELPVAVFGEFIYWYGHRKIARKKDEPMTKLTTKYLEMVGERIKSSTAEALTEMEQNDLSNVLSITTKRDQQTA